MSPGPNLTPPHEGQAPIPDHSRPIGEYVSTPVPQPAMPAAARSVNPALDGSAWSTALLALLPKALASLLIMLFVSPLLGLAWLAAGIAAFTDRFEPTAAKLMGLRPPNAAEKSFLRAAWSRVAARAGIDPQSHMLWVQDSSDINAAATIGRTVVVTRAALARLKDQPSQLEAILAHELGHHLRGHARIAFLLYFYGLPVDVVLRFAGRTLYLMFLQSTGFVTLAFMMLVPMVMIFPPTAILLLSWPISRYQSRKAELAADLFAADLGYGPVLCAVLQSWLDRGWDDGPRTLVAKVLATHPSIAERILHLETHDTGVE
ncbi:M48 family metalloprotease [Streptosporangium sp. NPDC004631]